MTDTCPSWPTLLAWLENDTADEESQLLNTHVADSDECREKLALMNAVQDVGDVELEAERGAVAGVLCTQPEQIAPSWRVHATTDRQGGH